jgi:hypothetical protein
MERIGEGAKTQSQAERRLVDAVGIEPTTPPV